MSPGKYPYFLSIFFATTFITQGRSEFSNFFRVQRQTASDECVTSSGSGGVCVPFRQCEEESHNLNIRRPAVCRWETHGPVICCSSPDKPRTQMENLNVSRCGLPALPNRRARQVAMDSEEHLVSSVSAFVIGGNDAELGKWPWMAIIFMEDDAHKKIPLCGATLISESVVVTAAHCFIGTGNSKLVVGLGLHSTKESENDAGFKEIKVNRVIQHKEFKYPAIYNDIALLILESKVTLTDRIQLVCLPNAFKNNEFVGKKATVTGWGQKEFGGAGAHILQEVDLSVFSNTDCSSSYKTLPGTNSTIPEGILKSIVCAGSSTEAKDACPGDSGGPLVFQTSTRNWVLIGVVSAGFNCGQKIPGIYTRVTEYLDWIETNLI